MSKVAQHTRLTIDIPAEVKQRLRLLAAHQNICIREYVLRTLEERPARD